MRELLRVFHRLRAFSTCQITPDLRGEEMREREREVKGREMGGKRGEGRVG